MSTSDKPKSINDPSYVPNPLTITPARFLWLESRLFREPVRQFLPPTPPPDGGEKEGEGRGRKLVGYRDRQLAYSLETVDRLLSILERSYKPGDVVTNLAVRRAIKVNTYRAKLCIATAKSQGRWPYVDDPRHGP